VNIAQSAERLLQFPHVVPEPEIVEMARQSRQMLADALNLPVTTSPEREASSRGAALLALEALGRLPRLWSSSPARGRSHQPRASVHAIYERARRRQQDLYDLLFPPRGGPEHATPIAAAESDSRKKDLRSPAARH